jgi:membrane protein DedA with SNARE-associated domain
LQFQTFVGWLQQLSVQYGYFGVFFVSLVGALSLVIPVPDTITIFTVAGFKVGGGWVVCVRTAYLLGLVYDPNMFMKQG